MGCGRTGFTEPCYEGAVMIEWMRPDGSMFACRANILVNPVNCVGVMGAGLALEFKRRFPAMYLEYKRECKLGKLQPGAPHYWRSEGVDPRGMYYDMGTWDVLWVVNFPTKHDWRQPSSYGWIEQGLVNLSSVMKWCGEEEIMAVPALGCGYGGLNWVRVRKLLEVYLGELAMQIKVFPPKR